MEFGAAVTTLTASWRSSVTLGPQTQLSRGAHTDVRCRVCLERRCAGLRAHVDEQNVFSWPLTQRLFTSARPLPCFNAAPFPVRYFSYTPEAVCRSKWSAVKFLIFLHTHTHTVVCTEPLSVKTLSLTLLPSAGCKCENMLHIKVIMWCLYFSEEFPLSHWKIKAFF